MRFYEAVPELLHRAGVERVFAMLGAMNVVFAAEGVRRGHFSLVNTRHEEAAVAAATAYARASGRLGVATVTRGPGFANTLNTLIAAEKSHVPILLIVGESPMPMTRDEYGYSEQQIPQRELSETIGVGFHHVASGAELEETFWAAVHAAWWKGTPQVLSLGNTLN
jgi:thiamine pyrophosphate-dependent acetolactate synthase large subunit-like protein